MPLLTNREVYILKLKSLGRSYLIQIARQFNLRHSGNLNDIAGRIMESGIEESRVDQFIRQKYIERIEARRALISDEDLKSELERVTNYSWGIVQGGLDSKVQNEYVRRYARYGQIIENVEATLHGEITNYVICAWFNHWTTVLIEEHISAHSRVIPTIKSAKGIDIFFDSQPFDLKVTYLPRGYEPDRAVSNPPALAKWMYENQGEQRFGYDNRFFIILLNVENRERSWELKRSFELVFGKIDEYLNGATVSLNDEINFSYKGQQHVALAKVLIITSETVAST